MRGERDIERELDILTEVVEPSALRERHHRPAVNGDAALATRGDRMLVDRGWDRERGFDGGTRALERGDRETAERLDQRAAELLGERADDVEEPRGDRERLGVAEL